jgi:membrane-bound lytic murein transglycosylase D
MALKHLLKLVILVLPIISSAYADTNAAGDEIVYQNDNDSSGQTPSAPDTAALPPLTENAAVDSDSLWQRIKNGYAMPDLDSPFTATHEAWYAARPDYVKRMVARSQKYLYHIVEEVQKRGMPTEIALLPMVESAFNPHALSTSRASGIWQFVPSTGKNFGLKQNWWVDNRKDVTAATDAALNYLQKLHVMFGSWDLALAAYNAGEGTVMRAIENNRRKGLPTDYQSLNLPAETKNYVPKLQAVKNIVTNPEQYGLDIQPIPNQPYFTQVQAPKQIDTKLAAKLAGVSMDEFISLNPEYNRPVITSTDGTHDILLPIGKDSEFANNLANYDKPLVSWKTYYAKRGEKLDNVARKFGVSVAELRNVNDIGAKNKLNNARPLLVPAEGDAAPAELPADAMATPPKSDNREDQSAPTKRHTVGKGENINSIAKKYGLSSKQLMALNHLKSGKLKNGQVLIVQAPSSTKTTQHQETEPTSRTAKNKPAKTMYLVRRGDTLASIARKFDVSTEELQRWNKLNGSRLTPGHKLVVSKSDAA